jgi:voltage-gated potassium channel
MLKKGDAATLENLTTDPRETALQLPCIPLYIKHADNSETLLPEADTPLQAGDQLLFCGRQGAEKHMLWTAHNFHAMSYICSGDNCPSGTLWRWLAERRGAPRSLPKP